MYSDSLCDAYETIYEAIRNYRDYCANERNATIEAMTHLNTMKYRYMVPAEYQIPLERQHARAKDIATFDYNKAIRGIAYCSGAEWSNHYLYE